MAHPHELVAEPDDGPAGAELLGDLFVAADQLSTTARTTPDGTITVLDWARASRGPPPYGLGKPEWQHLCERVTALGDLLLADDVDPDAVMDLGPRPPHRPPPLRSRAGWLGIGRVLTSGAQVTILAELEVFHLRAIA